MGFDFSAIDAELDALGRVPAELTSLAHNYAGSLGSLADIDRALDALGVAVELPPARPALRLEYTPSPAERFSTSSPAEGDAPLELSADDDDDVEASLDAALTPMLSMDPPANVGGRVPQSGEIPLPEPVRRAAAEEPVSGELSLDSEPPRSGSFELPAVESPQPAEPPAQAASEEPAPHDDPVLEVDALDDDEDLFSFQSVAPAPTPAGGAKLKGLSDLPPAGDAKPEGFTGGRDPDAEFDAIFSDATSPSGLPTRGFAFGDDDSPSADELLTGLEAAAPQSAKAALPAPGDDDGEPFLDAEDHTEILDSRTLNSITANAKQGDDNPFRDEEEFGSTDFEIVMDEEAEAAEPGDKPKDAKKTPPPPLPKPADPNDKRPSFLGRIFGRKDGQPPT